MRANRQDERGATLVEFAFVFPILALLFAALTDLGFMVLGSSVASNAAREGARVGLIHYLDADDPSSDAYDRIDAAVRDKLVGWVKPGVGRFVTVRCLDGDALGTVKPCDESIEVDHDVIEVVVSWEGIAGTGLIPVDRTKTSSARMVITGGADGPTGGGPVVPGGSEVGFDPITYSVNEGHGAVTLSLVRSNATGTASVNVETASGSADADIDYESVVTQVNFADGQGVSTVTVNVLDDLDAEGPESFSLTLSNPVGVTLRSGAATATVTIVDDDAAAPACPPPTLGGAVTVGLSGNSGQVHSAVSFTITLEAGCTAPQLRFTGSGVGSFASLRPPSAPCSTSCTWTIPKGDGGWTKGRKSIELVAGGVTFQFVDAVTVN